MPFIVITNPSFDHVNQTVEGFQSIRHSTLDGAVDAATLGFAPIACVVSTEDLMTPLAWTSPAALEEFIEWCQFPISQTFWCRVRTAPGYILDSIRRKLDGAQANPWVFSNTPQMFWQMAGPEEMEALGLLTLEEHDYLLGRWSEEDWTGTQ